MLSLLSRSLSIHASADSSRSSGIQWQLHLQVQRHGNGTEMRNNNRVVDGQRVDCANHDPHFMSFVDISKLSSNLSLPEPRAFAIHDCDQHQQHRLDELRDFGERENGRRGIHPMSSPLIYQKVQMTAMSLPQHSMVLEAYPFRRSFSDNMPADLLSAFRMPYVVRTQ